CPMNNPGRGLLRPRALVELVGISEQRRAAAQLSGAVAVSKPDVAATGYGPRTIINLVVDAAVVGTNEMAVAVAAMVLKPARQERHCNPAIGELLHCSRLAPLGPPLRRRTCRRHGGKQRRPPHQCFHSAASFFGGSCIRFDAAEAVEKMPLLGQNATGFSHSLHDSFCSTV